MVTPGPKTKGIGDESINKAAFEPARLVKTTMLIATETIALDRPQAGIAIARAPADLLALNEPDIHAVVYVPRDVMAMKVFCEHIGELSSAPNRKKKLNKTAANMVRDNIFYYRGQDARVGKPQHCQLSPTRVRDHLADPLWQAAFEEISALTAALAKQQVATDRVEYMSFHLATYLNDNLVWHPHIDHGYKIIGTIAEKGTQLELERNIRFVTAPAYHPLFYKDSRRHCAPPYETSLFGVQRPRYVPTWDLCVDRIFD